MPLTCVSCTCTDECKSLHVTKAASGFRNGPHSPSFRLIDMFAHGADGIIIPEDPRRALPSCRVDALSFLHRRIALIVPSPASCRISFLRPGIQTPWRFEKATEAFRKNMLYVRRNLTCR